MKRYISMILTVFLLLTCIFVEAPKVYAAKKDNESRAIAIVFDNSGSMYEKGNQAWCRATYAMEVFASMLNTGDVLEIYPMNPIEVGGSQYTMDSPLKISNTSQANKIRDIFTPDGGKTYIKSIDCAANGLKKQQADKKYLIILTDGGTFTEDNGKGMSKSVTKKQLEARIAAYAGADMHVMYLGIDKEACMPGTAQSAYFTKNKAENSADVLAKLTDMCNQIFGRDILPSNHKSGRTIDFDISMSKLIVFVQGENISDLKITGNAIGEPVNSQQTMYSTKGAGDYKSVPDNSLQGMMVTYTDCPAGTYQVEFTGTETSFEVYYEPDADLDFVFTDSAGNNVDYNALYGGDYKVAFGLKDAKTGQLISSDLLGKPHYEGSYTINGNETSITKDGHSGEVPIKLEAGDTFKANLTVNYLSGYTISKDSSDFGWPEGGVEILAPPLGSFQADLSVPQNYIVIGELDQSSALVVDLKIDGQKLSAEEFDAVTVAVDCGGIAHTVTPNKEESQYLIKLDATQGIAEGSYLITVDAKYADALGRETGAKDESSVTLSNTPLWLKWLIGFLLLILLILLVVLITRIRKLPSCVRPDTEGCSLRVGGKDVSDDANFFAKLSGKQMVVHVEYNADELGRVSVRKLTPAPGAFWILPSHKRSISVKFPESVSSSGELTAIDIAGVEYKVDANGVMVPAEEQQAPYTITHGASITMNGKTQVAGKTKNFSAEIPLSFRKK